MVKFGRHIQAFLENEHDGSDLYVVPYNDIRRHIPPKQRHRGNAQKLDFSCWFPGFRGLRVNRFASEWRTALSFASEDFSRATRAMWNCVFGVIDCEDARGMLPDAALRIFLSSAPPPVCHGLMSTIRSMRSTALTNAEALRKLVKKFDKEAAGRGDVVLSCELLPEVYAANFTVGIPTLESALALFRAELVLDDSDDDDELAEYVKRSPQNSLAQLVRQDSEHVDGVKSPSLLSRSETFTDDLTVGRRFAELRWLREMVSMMPYLSRNRIISHRGFHWPSDRSDTRPIENSLQAYEAAWTSGIHLCECDIALTKDERLILCHDETLSRLAMDPESEIATTRVKDLTLRQLMALPLKSGARPPLLVEVLRAAQNIGVHAKLVIEIKPGNPEVSPALARMFMRYPDLCGKCEGVISFDAFAMHTLRRELNGLITAAALPGRGTVTMPTSMSLAGLRLQHASPRNNDANVDMDNGARRQSCTGLSSYHRLNSMESMGLDIERKDSFAPSAAPFGPHIKLGSSPKSNGLLGNNLRLNNVTLLGSTQKLNGQLLGTSPKLNGPIHNVSSMARASEREPNSITVPAPVTIPKLMLLTVSEPPEFSCQLFVGISNTSKVKGWLCAHDGSLDGIYMQYQPEMMTPKGSAALSDLSDEYTVGVWSHVGRDPDNWTTFHHLTDGCGVSYVNSALPRKFIKGLSASQERSDPVPVPAPVFLQ